MAGEDNDVQEATPELIAEARLMGWQPKEEYKGKEENWVDVHEYLERGRKIAPILKANNERLLKEALTQKQLNDKLKAELAELRKEVDEFKEQSTTKQIAEKKAELLEQLKAARQDDDVELEFKLREQIDALKPEPKKKQEPEPPAKDDGLSPEFKAWNADNPWFGGTSSEDRKKTKEVYRILEDLREEGSPLYGRAIMDEAVNIYNRRTGKKEDDEPNDKHEPGNHSVSGRQTGKGFSSLPQAAKQACWEDNEKFVGEGKLFKTQKDWENHYYNEYMGYGQ